MTSEDLSLDGLENPTTAFRHRQHMSLLPVQDLITIRSFEIENNFLPFLLLTNIELRGAKQIQPHSNYSVSLRV